VACGKLAIKSVLPLSGLPLSSWWLALGNSLGEYVARKSVNDGVCRRMKSGTP
jgi:hypothetical protein